MAKSAIEWEIYLLKKCGDFYELSSDEFVKARIATRKATVIIRHPGFVWRRQQRIAAFVQESERHRQQAHNYKEVALILKSALKDMGVTL